MKAIDVDNKGMLPLEALEVLSEDLILVKGGGSALAGEPDGDGRNCDCCPPPGKQD